MEPLHLHGTGDLDLNNDMSIYCSQQPDEALDRKPFDPTTTKI